ncbi:4-coumarate--CoA ligase 3-like [Coccinella septempunctata]|uniref:4-coumarate--CoA ligase 3-like n=1 Tax=Coccinella septempunctata TaxID=41139 RepID=UPI001D09109E|nr:4-coumarate--CoA ligase 3-like [Coccinella septempunctata]
MAGRLVPKNLNVIKKVLQLSKRTLTSDQTISGHVIGSGFPDVEIPKLTLPEFFEPYFDKFERFTAIECSETKRKYTYGEINRKSINLAKAFRKIFKLNDGDVVAVILSNIPEYPIASLGILRANLVITTVSPAFTSDEIFRQLDDSGAKLVITELDQYSKVSQSIRKTLKKMQVMIIKTNNGQDLPNDTIDFHELLNAEINYPDIRPGSPENTAFLPYSSGTTGLPKGVQLTHNNIVSNLFQHHKPPEVRFLNETSDDFQEIFPTTLPLYHAFGYNVVMNGSVIHGGKVVTLRKFSPKAYTTMLKEYPCSTGLYVVPPLVLMLINSEDAKVEYLRNLRFLVSGAAPLSESDEQRFLEKFGDHIAISQGYGMTETTSIISYAYPNVIKGRTSSKGSVGIPLFNTRIKILNIDDEKSPPLGPLKTGEIYVKGPQVMKGYLNRPEETTKCLSTDGWLRTGDIGYYNEDGFLFITDRFKELIKVKAHQVPPAELESIIRSFPGVSEAAVIGIPHPSSGEVPRAYVVPKKGTVIDVKKLDEFVSSNVAKYKELKGGIVVVDEIPKSPSGKILRRLIKEEFSRNDR